MDGKLVTLVAKLWKNGTDWSKKQEEVG